jgi:hypothetical protein
MERHRTKRVPVMRGNKVVGIVTRSNLKPMSALPPKADMCGATRDVRFGPEADITELGCHQRLDFTSFIAGFVAPLPFHRSPLSSSKPKQLG